MADVNNKLRLQIATELDAAGIKATKAQIESLEQGVKRAGASGEEMGSKFGRLEKALGRLPGPLGRIGGALGGLLGQATMVAGAFSMGVEIGNKIVGQLEKWGLMKDPIKDLVAENKKYELELKVIKDSLNEVVAAENKRLEISANVADKALKRIDDQTAAYFRQAAALEGIRKAQGNAEMLQLERAKFEDMKAYSDMGYAEAAEQLGKYYDVLVAELTTKQQLAAFDRESVKLTKELTDAELAHKSALERANEAKGKAAAAEAELLRYREKYGINGGAMYDSEEKAAKDDALEKIAERSRIQAEKAAEVAAKRSQRIENVDAEILTRQMERANLAANGVLGIDRAAQAYDDYALANGNPLNATIGADWAAELIKISEEADQNQRAILEEVKSFGDRLERLLEIK